MILVTGATGFVGSHLVYHLVTNGCNLKLLIRNTKHLSELERCFIYYDDNYNKYISQIQIIEGDLFDTDILGLAMKDVKYVFHCAGLVSFNKSDKQNLIEINKHGTANVVNAALQSNIKKLIYISSIAALGEINDELINETNQKFDSHSSNVYGISKYLGELEVRRGIEEGLNAIIINPSVIIGPGNISKGTPAIFKLLNNGFPFYSYGITGYIDVRDVVKIMLKLAVNNINNEQFILNNINISNKEFFTTITNQLNKKPPKYKLNKRVTIFIASIINVLLKLMFFKSSINASIAKSLFSVNKYDNTKIKNSLNYNFIDFSDTIKFASKCIKKH